MPDPNPDDRLPPTGDHDPPALSSRRRPIVCEHCECQLTQAGEVLKFSDRAKGYRKHDETIEKLNEKIGTLETELRDARAKLAELTPSAAGNRNDLEW